MYVAHQKFWLASSEHDKTLSSDIWKTLLPIKTVVLRTYFGHQVQQILIFSKPRRLLTRCKKSLNRSRKSRSSQLYLLLNKAPIYLRHDLENDTWQQFIFQMQFCFSLCQKKKENWSINEAISRPINHDFSLHKASQTHSLCFFPFFCATPQKMLYLPPFA